MQYNIYFELVSIFFVAIMLLYHKLQYSDKTVINYKFRMLVVMVLLDNILDIASAMGITHYEHIDSRINMFITTIYFMVASILAYQLTSYVREVIRPNKKKNFMFYFNVSLIIFYVSSLVINSFTHWFMWFDGEGIYRHGTLYAYIFVAPFYFISYSGIYLFYYRKYLQIRQVWSVGLYVFITFAGIFIQTFITPTVLLTGFAAALALLVVLFLLETPDYQKLMKTMKELEIARDEAERERKRADFANQAKSRFLTNVSHEVRTPINAILGMNEMILRETEEDVTKQYAMDIKSSGLSLLGMINEILDSAVIESGKMTINCENYDLGKMLRNVIKMIDILVKEKNLVLQTEIATDLPSIIKGDGKRVQQVLLNLLTNAIKYTKSGKIKLIVNGSAIEDTLHIHFEVKDNGIGIKQEDFPRLFAPYDRIENEQNKGVEGTGLGINIAEQILSLMDSNLVVQSEYGKGSCFGFDLTQKIVDAKPIKDFSIQSKEETEYSYTASFEAPQAKILVVDDSKINLRVFCNLLKKTKVHVTTAESGAECLKKITEEHFDLIFLDHMMPEMDGKETFKRMKEMEHHLCKNTPVVMLTANASDEARDSYLREGFDEFLSKPVMPEQLEQTIVKLLHMRVEKNA